MNNDLISREALKKALELIDYNDIYDLTRTEHLIDNAQTVEPCKDCEDKRQAEYIRHGSSWHELQALRKFKEEHKRPQGEFSRKDLESWLYQIAMNNIGTDFEKSVVEIIHRLDGFERFVSEQKGGAE